MLPDQEIEFSLISLDGKVLFKGHTEPNKQFDISRLNQGVYIIELRINDVIVIKKLMVI